MSIALVEVQILSAAKEAGCPKGDLPLFCGERRGFETRERRANARISRQDVGGSDRGGPEGRSRTLSPEGQILSAAKEAGCLLSLNISAASCVY